MSNKITARAPLPPVTVHVTGQGYHLVCHALGVSCTAPSLEAGYAALSELAAAASATAGFSEAEQHMPPSSDQAAVMPTPGRSQFQKGILLIIMAATVPILVMIAIVLNDARFVIKQIRTATSALTAYDDKRNMGAGSLAIVRTAEWLSTMPPERQEELRRNLEMISLQLAPIAKGLRPLVEALDTSSASPASSPAAPVPQQ